MISLLLRGRLAACFFVLFALPAAAQQQQQPVTTQRPPPSAQARRVQDLLQNSGMTLEQVRKRLRAEGYPENVLDPYFSGRSTTAIPDTGVFSAVRALRLEEVADSVTRRRKESLKSDTTQKLRVGKAKDSVTAFLEDRELLDSLEVALKDTVARAAFIELLRSKDKRQAMLDSGFTTFGLDVFNRESTLFDANDAGPVPLDYRVGPGDELVLVLTGDTERSFTVPVTREGMIFVPNVGGVPVANLTMAQLEDVLYTRLARAYSGIRRGPGATAHFQISVSKLGSIQVSVLGDVTKPGAYQVSKLGTVLTALYAAGGPSASGSLRNIEVHRGGKLVVTLDMYDYLISGSSQRDVKLESGDIVLVPPRDARVRVAGGVIRPATYELKAGETLGDLVRMAGGFRPEADRRRVQIERSIAAEKRVASGSDRMLFDVAGASLEASREPLVAGDIVRVSLIAGRIANQIKVTGNVWSPGLVAFVPGMRVADAIARAGGVKPNTYHEMQLTRLQPDSTLRALRLTVPGVPLLADGTDGNGLASDMELQPDDEIRVFSLSEYRPERYVTVGGAVGKSGRYPYREGMTVRDLLMIAGGVQEGALLTEAEVARMPFDRREGSTAITIRVPLDSSYLFDRLPGAAYAGPPGVPAPAHHAPEFELKAYDNVTVMLQPDWLLPRIVTVKGQVKYPGDYALKSKSERLVDVINRAGGLTRDAYAGGIVFKRSQDSVGRIGIDLPAALKNRSRPDNILLADGDTIEIPMHSAVVMVTGAVNSPVAVPYVPGAYADYYVYGAGGPTARGDLRRVYVVQPSGKVESSQRHWWGRYPPRPQPGSTVTVPERIPGQQRVDLVGAFAAVASIGSSLVALLVILHR
jgi:protein involved in polysaccharide export with SLBB domain